VGINFRCAEAHHVGMSHDTHLAGTVNACPDCRSIAYEPSWYAAMMAFEPTIDVRERAVARV
jgi:hypothetical protein